MSVNLNNTMESILETIFVTMIIFSHSYAQDCQTIAKPNQKSCTFKFQNITLFEIKNLRRANEIVCEFEGDLSNLRYVYSYLIINRGHCLSVVPLYIENHLS